MQKKNKYLFFTIMLMSGVISSTAMATVYPLGHTHMVSFGKPSVPVPACSLEGYPLLNCPEHGICVSETCNGVTQYALTACDSGWFVSEGNCEVNPLSDCDWTNYYNWGSCKYPAKSCWEKTCDGETRYRAKSCEQGYHILQAGYYDYCVKNNCLYFGGSTELPPEGATGITTCTTEDTIYYKFTGCKEGYLYKNNTCEKNYCENYPFSSNNPPVEVQDPNCIRHTFDDSSGGLVAIVSPEGVCTDYLGQKHYKCITCKEGYTSSKRHSPSGYCVPK